MRKLTFVLVSFLCLIPSAPAHAFSEGGHHLIAAIAFNRLSRVEQVRVLEILAKHPRYAEDFVSPKNLPTERDIQRWLVGRAGYWADVARRQPKTCLKTPLEDTDISAVSAGKCAR